MYIARKSDQMLDQVMQKWEGVRSDNSYPILVITDEALKMLIEEGSVQFRIFLYVPLSYTVLPHLVYLKLKTKCNFHVLTELLDMLFPNKSNRLKKINFEIETLRFHLKSMNLYVARLRYLQCIENLFMLFYLRIITIMMPAYSKLLVYNSIFYCRFYLHI